MDTNIAQAPIGFAGLPSFMPYLLREKSPKTLQQLLGEVRRQRRSPAVKEYRKWRQELQDDWVQRGLINRDKERALKRVAERVCGTISR
jgi:hypothetical protein